MPRFRNPKIGAVFGRGLHKVSRPDPCPGFPRLGWLDIAAPVHGATACLERPWGRDAIESATLRIRIKLCLRRKIAIQPAQGDSRWAESKGRRQDACYVIAGRKFSTVIRPNSYHKHLKHMARPTGFEPVAPSLEGSCSIQLSYGRAPHRS